MSYARTYRARLEVFRQTGTVAGYARHGDASYAPVKKPLLNSPMV